MSYKILKKTDSEITFEIVVGESKLKKIVEIVVSDLGKTVNVPGFRPGKAPQFLIEKEVGQDKFWSEVINKAVPESYYEALVAEKINPISQPQIKIKEMIPNQKIVFEAKVAVLPEFKDFKYKDLDFKHQKQKATPKELEDALKGFCQKYSEEKEVKRASKKGDRVEIDFKGTINGLPFDGGESKNHPLVLGSQVMVPGFEEKIIGHKTGEKFKFSITFPKDYHAKNLAGKKVDFEVKINKVFERIVPKPDDSFAKKVGFKSAQDLKKELKKELDFQKDLAKRREIEEKIIEKIIEKNKINAPEPLVEEEIHRMFHEAEHNLSRSGLTLDRFLKDNQKTLDDLHQEMRPEAEKRVKIGIVFGEIAKNENIKVSEEEINQEIEKIVDSADPSIDKNDLKTAFDSPEKRREIANSILIKKSLEKIWKYNVKE